MPVRNPPTEPRSAPQMDRPDHTWGGVTHENVLVMVRRGELRTTPGVAQAPPLQGLTNGGAGVV